MKDTHENPLFDLLKPAGSPEEAKQRLGRALPIQHLEIHTTYTDWFLSETSVLTETLKIVSIDGANYHLQCKEDTYHYLFLGHGGYTLIHQDSHSSILTSNTGMLLARPSWSLACEEWGSFTAIGFLPLQLISTARTMVHPGWRAQMGNDSLLGSLFRLPIPGDPTCIELCKAAISITIALAKIGNLGEKFLYPAGLDQDLYKVIALIAFEDLRNLEVIRSGEASDAVDRNLEQVLDFIRLNIDQRLTISLLQKQTTYSRRSLQYLFQEQLGCSPQQWIRQQRMALAFERLQTSNPSNSTVREIASRCGYRSLSRFYIDFRRTYGCKPYDILKSSVSEENYRSNRL